MIDPESEQADFISARELVALIAGATGDGEQRAATMLAASLARKTGDWYALPLFEFDPVHGLVEITETNRNYLERYRFTMRIDEWARTGQSRQESQPFMSRDLIDSMGFRRSDVFPLLVVGGILKDDRNSMPSTNAELREALEVARAHCAALQAEVDKLRAESTSAPEPDWTRHGTRLFKLLKTVIELGGAYEPWPKQEFVIAKLMQDHPPLSQAEAKALDAVTRPDELRRKKDLPSR